VQALPRGYRARRITSASAPDGGCAERNTVALVADSDGGSQLRRQLHRAGTGAECLSAKRKQATDTSLRYEDSAV
jgi:hypothetical protein